MSGRRSSTKAEGGFDFVQHHDFTPRLNDLEGLREQIGVRDAIGQAVQAGARGATRLAVAAKDLRARGFERLFARFEIGENVPKVF